MVHRSSQYILSCWVSYDSSTPVLFNDFSQKCCLILVCQTLMFISSVIISKDSLGPSDLAVQLLHTSLDAILKAPTGSQVTCGLSQGSETNLVTGSPSLLPGPDNTECETHSHSSGPLPGWRKPRPLHLVSVPVALPSSLSMCPVSSPNLPQVP